VGCLSADENRFRDLKTEYFDRVESFCLEDWVGWLGVYDSEKWEVATGLYIVGCEYRVWCGRSRTS
jgi:hypothetical protein